MPCQCIKLVGKRQLGTAFQQYLTFADHIHNFDADQEAFGRSKWLVLHGFFKEPQGFYLVSLGHQQKVDRLALLVHSLVELFPNAVDLDISFVHAPTGTHGALALVKDFFKQGKKPDFPAVICNPLAHGGKVPARRSP